MADPNSIAKVFVERYISLFGKNWNEFGAMYQSNSTMSFEGAMAQGPQAIVEKLTSLPIGKMERAIDTMDVQISGQGSLLVMITGRLIIDAETQAQRFTHVFQIVVTNPNTFFIQNEMFRLNYG